MLTKFWSLFQGESPSTTFQPTTFPIMKSVKTGEEMEQFKGKIIVYETTSSYLGDEDGALIEPERKELKVGLVDKRTSPWDSHESGYALHQLRVTGAVEHNQALTPSRLQDANFKARLPSPKELEKIKEIVSSKKAQFPYPWCPDMDDKIDDILKKIDKQKAETRNPVTIRKLKR